MKRIFNFIILMIMGVLVIPNCVFADILTIDVNTEDELRKVLEERKDLEGNVVTADELVVNIAKDIKLSGIITVTERDITINLNGKVLSYDSSVAGEAMITNRGKLTITDNTDLANGKILFKYIGEPDISYGKGNYTISNGGTLIIENGIVENATDKMSHACYAIDNNSINSASNLTVNGGKIINTYNYSVRQIAGSNKNSITINDGLVTGTRAVWIQLPGSNTDIKPDVSFNVTGGKLIGTGESSTYKLAIYSYSYGNSLENVKINISGGELEGDIALSGGYNKTISELVNITGGKITDVYSYADDEKTRIDVSGGIYDFDVYSEYLKENYVSKKVGEDFVVGLPRTVTLSEVKNGTASVSEKEDLVVGETVTITAVASEGYELSLLKVVDADNEEVEVVDGKFVMPDSNVTITIEFSKITHTVDVPTVVVPEEKVEEPVIGVEKADEIEEILLDSLMEYGIVEDLNNSVTVALEVNTMEEEAIDEKLVEKMEEAAGKAKIATYFDITVAIRNSLDDSLVGVIPELTKEIELMILLPENLKNADKDVERVYYVVRRHIDENNKETFESLEAKLSEDGNYLIFKTDKFSTYALAYEDVKVEEVLSPDTFDGIGTYFAIGSLSLIALAGISIFAKKKLFN